MHTHLAGTDAKPAAGASELKIHHGMRAEEYHAIPALSNSSMKDLAVSPLRFWARHIDPHREPEPEKDAFVLGEALHCLVLEPAKFEERFACELDQADFPGCLSTVADLKQFLKDKGQKVPSGALKADLIAQVTAFDPTQVIWERMTAEHARANENKTVLTVSGFARASFMARLLRAEPRVAEILKTGDAEVSIVGRLSFTIGQTAQHVASKCRLDWTNDGWIVDFKTFSTLRGNSVEKSIADAIFYQGYYKQAWLYKKLDQEARKAAKPKRFLMVFIESEWPHDIRLKEFRAFGSEGRNLYDSLAETEIWGLCALYNQCVREFGTKQWLKPQFIDPLEDIEIRQLAFA